MPDLALITLAELADDLERIRIANDNRIRALTDTFGSSLPHLDILAAQLAQLERTTDLELRRQWRKDPLAAWVKTIPGAGERTVARLVATIGDPAERPNVAKLWAYCVPAGAMVATEHGNRPIETIRPAFDRVVGADGLLHDVDQVLVRTVAEQIIVLKARKMLPVRVTAEHPILTARFKQRDTGYSERTELRWTYADQVTTEDFLVVPKLRAAGTDIAPALARLYGRFVGDGSTTINHTGRYERGRCALSFGHHEDVAPWLRRVRSTHGSGSVVEMPTGKRIDFGRLKLARQYREMFGESAATKHVSRDVLLAPRDSTVAFLNGYFSADGYLARADATHRASQTSNTVSQALALDLQLLATRLGALGSIHLDARAGEAIIAGRVVNQRDRYRLAWNGSDTIRLAGGEADSVKARHREDDEFFYVPVADISRESHDGYVYDLACGGSFLVNNVIVHNCGHGDPERSRIPKGATQEQLLARGNPDAKKRVFLIAEAILKTGVRTTKNAKGEVVERHATNPWGQMYLDQRVKYADKKHVAACPRCGPAGKPALPGSDWSAAHQHGAALRYVGKQFLRELWRESRRLANQAVET